MAAGAQQVAAVQAAAAAGAPTSEMLLVLLVRAGLWMGLTRAHDFIIDSAPILAWRRADPDPAIGHAPAHRPRPLLRRRAKTAGGCRRAAHAASPHAHH